MWPSLPFPSLLLTSTRTIILWQWWHLWGAMEVLRLPSFASSRGVCDLSGAFLPRWRAFDLAWTNLLGFDWNRRLRCLEVRPYCASFTLGWKIALAWSPSPSRAWIYANWAIHSWLGSFSFNLRLPRSSVVFHLKVSRCIVRRYDLCAFPQQLERAKPLLGNLEFWYLVLNSTVTVTLHLTDSALCCSRAREGDNILSNIVLISVLERGDESPQDCPLALVQSIRRISFCFTLATKRKIVQNHELIF